MFIFREREKETVCVCACILQGRSTLGGLCTHTQDFARQCFSPTGVMRAQARALEGCLLWRLGWRWGVEVGAGGGKPPSIRAVALFC